MKYIVSVDQSTQGTKGLLFNSDGELLARTDIPHKQIVDDRGWVEHDPKEILKNTKQVIKDIITTSEVSPLDVVALGISNQRETAICWNKKGKPLHNAIVWQCARGEGIVNRLRDNIANFDAEVKSLSGLPASPYFSAAKFAWILENVDDAKKALSNNTLRCGTVDSFLVYNLTNGISFKTDYSNASRTQLLNINKLCWDEKLCKMYGVPLSSLPQLCDSDAFFGTTTLDGFFSHDVPIHSVLGDSHAALFGQGCIDVGMIKATYGTGSSVMMNIGEKPVHTELPIATSVGWAIKKKTVYVLEGNINYTGSVVSWLKDDLHLISTPHEADICAEQANLKDSCVLVPAFTGLGAPYYKSDAKAIISNMSRTTGKNEICRAALNSIAYQINDVIDVMREVSGHDVSELRVDGGPTRSRYLMGFQSGITDATVSVPSAEELSGIGAAFAAGVGVGLYDIKKLNGNIRRQIFYPNITKEERDIKKSDWQQAVSLVLNG